MIMVGEIWGFITKIWLAIRGDSNDVVNYLVLHLF